jgi:hypothetical protein
MMTVSSTSILPRLEHLLEEEMQLHAKLTETETAGDGLFNEISSGPYTISSTLPDETKLTAMREEWIPAVTNRLTSIFQNTKGCFHKMESLNESIKTTLFPGAAFLLTEDIENIAIYNPGFAHTIMATDLVARRLTEEIQSIHIQNASLLGKVLHRKEAFSNSLGIDLWRYSITNCRGTTPSTIQWLSAPYKGTFAAQIEAAPVAPTTWEPVAIAGKLKEAPALEVTKEPFPLVAQKLNEAFQRLFTTSKQREKKDLYRYLESRLDSIRENIAKIGVMLERPLDALLHAKIIEQIQGMQTTLVNPSFMANKKALLEIQDLYATTLPSLVPKESYAPSTLERISYLDLGLRDQLSEIQTAWKKSLAELNSNHLWMSFKNPSSIEELQGQLNTLFEKATA